MSDTLELEIQVLIGQMWVLENKPGFSARAARAFNSRAVSPAPIQDT